MPRRVDINETTGGENRTNLQGSTRAAGREASEADPPAGEIAGSEESRKTNDTLVVVHAAALCPTRVETLV